MAKLNLKKALNILFNGEAKSTLKTKKIKAYKMQPLTEDEINQLMSKAVEKYNRDNSRNIFQEDYWSNLCGGRSIPTLNRTTSLVYV